jgi:hypothetical protein
MLPISTSANCIVQAFNVQPFSSTCCITNASLTGWAAGWTWAIASLENNALRPTPIHTVNARRAFSVKILPCALLALKLTCGLAYRCLWTRSVPIHCIMFDVIGKHVISWRCFIIQY